jgi:ribosome-binding factor A
LKASKTRLCPANPIIMETLRQQKVARLFQKELSQLFQKEGGLYAPGGMITVTVVRVSPDLGTARVYLSVFPSAHGQAVLENIRHATRHIRYQLGQSVRHQIRVVPELSFHIDDSLDYAERIDDLLK